jgi:hypothetical protein
MDETKTIPTDSLPGGKAPEASDGITPPIEAKTQYTQEDVDKLLQADRIKRGRDDKTLATRKADLDAQHETITAKLARIEEWERQQDATELAEAQKDPAKMRAYQAKQAENTRAKTLDQREADLKKREQEHTRKEAETAETVRAAQQHQMDTKVYEIAARHELNPEDLKAGLKDLNLTTVEQAEALAKRLGRPPEGEKKTTTPVSVPTTGGARGTPTQEQREKMPMDDYAALRKKEDPNLI